MLRTTTSLIFTEDGTVEVVKDTQEKMEQIEAILVNNGLIEENA